MKKSYPFPALAARAATEPAAPRDRGATCAEGRRHRLFRSACTCLAGAPLRRLRVAIEDAANERGGLVGPVRPAQRPLSIALDLLEEIEQRRRGPRRSPRWR